MTKSNLIGILGKVEVGCSALGGEIYLYRKSSKPGVALDKRPAEPEVMRSIVEHMMYDAPKGSIKTISFGDKKFKITVVPYDN